MLLQELKPEPLWHYFEEICRIPRPSKKEGKIAAYLMDFAQNKAWKPGRMKREMY